MVLDFSPAADSEWQLILERDRILAESIDPLLDQIEAGETPGQMFANHVRFTTLRVPGRDELYCIVWEVREDYLYVVRIGRV
jgi:hypothetical protein